MISVVGALLFSSLLIGQTISTVTEKVTEQYTVASITPEQIEDWNSNSQEIKDLLQRSLDLTRMNLKYLYGSADPGKGGMDCSGTIFFLLTQSGVPGVPRQASEQYVWVRRENFFRAVFSTSNDSFELADLHPGDLLFWTGTYNVERDPPITHVMLYLGKRKSDHLRIMCGASEGRMYDGIPRKGVSVFEFRLPGFPAPKNYKTGSGAFIGYARIPNLPEAEIHPPSGTLP